MSTQRRGGKRQSPAKTKLKRGFKGPKVPTAEDRRTGFGRDDDAGPGAWLPSADGRDDDASVTPEGKLGEELGAREFEQYAYCYKTMPSCEQEKDFDADPLLVRLQWNQKHENSWLVDAGELQLLESPMDPVADVPIHKILRFEYEEGQTESNGRVLRSIPGDWILPFHHQRYDDTSGLGIEI